MKAQLAILFSVLVLAWSSPAYCGEIQDLIIFDHVAKLKALIEANPNLVNSKDSDGWTPLHYAIFSNNEDIIKLLLANHAKPSIQDAAAMGDLARVKALLKANPDLVNTKNNHGYTALQYAVFRGHKNVVAFLLAHKAEVNGEQGAGNTPLMEAAWNGDKDIVELLLTNNAEVNARDADGWTALHTAVVQRELDVVKMLLAHKADVNAKADDGITGGMTPLHKAAENGYEDVVKVLLANGANINAKDDKGETPLNLAIFYGHTDTAKILRQHGGNQGTNFYKRTSLDSPSIPSDLADFQTPTNLAKQIASADRIVVTNGLSEYAGFSLILSGNRAKKMVRAIASARCYTLQLDPGWLPVWELQFYRGTKHLATVSFLGAGFVDGKKAKWAAKENLQ